ncbi:hypothetical protein Pst134EA_032221 [Puccinia striiformis f. sp. tritici]|uniref:uncharacterized protein n=1 Tax=Puccinia striiformis f. sp. tritici TaxID=168172 RepID=UPI002008A597|nr:uncharacterized protein Pst134EA_032221 [Puccinia striiformis f. sp. tritici]KAH9444346.1 hypothetical protein Pst134EA_032221 [Puccinia striiformis f. sp. tritici]
MARAVPTSLLPSPTQQIDLSTPIAHIHSCTPATLHPFQSLSAARLDIVLTAAHLHQPPLLSLDTDLPTPDRYIRNGSMQPTNIVPPLHFPEVNHLLPELLRLGFSADYASLLYQEFLSAVTRMDETLIESYHTDAPKFLRNAGTSQVSQGAYLQAIQGQLLGVRAESLQKIWGMLLSRGQALAQQSGSVPSISYLFPISVDLDLQRHLHHPVRPTRQLNQEAEHRNSPRSKPPR